ncbi:peptidyl serine alpha-galactosyltransferase [Chloropicon primus]|uniref:ShKT domain-containing protein n=1 Tax=Chloropicon primus TaxID=1764295 RepID=A0A5B8MCS9_9CHLO|nr:hypothetical protein A3770_01p04990 [Chloropicon primus]UPQ97196.1 peptidyl serine alpha-galactosyltransferase [Chloropicon primus]|eukprot:QDZ17981.1 hypothetical protein A3770_01p04990 [Chloropicon primus]
MCRSNKRKFGGWGVLVVFLLLVQLTASGAGVEARTGAGGSEKSFHIIFSTECTPYFDYQSLGLLHSYAKVNQTGKITRLMACNDENYRGKHLTDRFSNADTFVHRNYAVHPDTGDAYPAYNKPYSVLSWLKEAEPEEDFIVFLDADMVITQKISVEAIGAELGRPASALYGYLKGVDPDSYMEVKASVPNVEKADKVGGFMVMHKEDMKRLAPWWLHYTEEVRNNPKNWANTGDVFNKNGELGPPWISEMYGYIFGCAHVNLKHIISNDFMLYPGYTPPPEPFPFVIHYGITFFVDDYAFDKHWFQDLTTCPGKNIDYPLTLAEIAYKKETDPRDYRRSALALYAPQILHEALEIHQRDYCHAQVSARFRHEYECASPQGIIMCNATTVLEGEVLRSRIRANEGAGGGTKARGPEAGRGGSDPEVLPASDCKDDNDLCCDWARSGECQANAPYMMDQCKASCGVCGPSSCTKAAEEPKREEEAKYSPVELHDRGARDGHGQGHYFGRDRHAFHHNRDHAEMQLDQNLFNGANGALFQALPFWGSLCVVGVVGASVVQALRPAWKRRSRGPGHSRNRRFPRSLPV